MDLEIGRLCQIIWTCPESNHNYPYKREAEVEVNTNRGREGNVITDTETGVMQPQAMEGLGPPEAGRSQKGSSPRGFRGNMALPTP